MAAVIGIREEDKYAMERRAPITPHHVEKLTREQGLGVVVQTSSKRVFPDKDYEKAGARIAPDMKGCDVVFGVKEIPSGAFEKDKTYVFFSHVIKGQPYNMPMLKKMMEQGCNLIDYERIVDDQGKRLIFFGKFAGLAGMINSLWSLGQRLDHYGISPNPFGQIKQSRHYASLKQAKKDISVVGLRIAEKGLPKELLPLTIGFTGYGNVSVGAQEIANLLPSMEISPEELLKLQQDGKQPDNVIYKVVFRERHISRRKDGLPFDIQDYYHHPEKYENDFEQYLPHLTVLMNCMYWDNRYPRIVTKDFLKKMFAAGRPQLTVIGDITCDPDGSVECTHKGTEIDDPVFVYDPATENHRMGFGGDGILVMAVDILPSELPMDASMAFADALLPFVKPIAEADYSLPADQLRLPGAIKKALILHRGRLTPAYRYIQTYLDQTSF